MGIYLDLKKAFDAVDYNILLWKLHNYGIRGVVHSWFTSYLNNRTQIYNSKWCKFQQATSNMWSASGFSTGTFIVSSLYK